MAFIELPTADLTASTFKSKANKWVKTPGLVDLQVNGFAGVDFNSSRPHFRFSSTVS